jgi:hypothetical protein
MKPTVVVRALFIFGVVSGCSNPANVRTLASSIQTVTGDVPNIVAADEAACKQNASLEDEYDKIEGQVLVPPSCIRLAAVLDSILAENKALQAYSAALSNLAQDQFVTADTDAKAVTTTLQNLKVVSSPVVAAVGSVFSFVETAALQGYRQKELSTAMTGEPATAFKTIMGSYAQLADQYSEALDSRLSNIDLVKNEIVPHHQRMEPVAVAEISARLTVLHDRVAAKSRSN